MECYVLFREFDKRTKDSTPRLVIIEQPTPTTYFRNESEITNHKHGWIKSARDNTKGPTVKLVGCNSNDDVLITCKPYCRNVNNEFVIHPYRLVKHNRTSLTDVGAMDPYECVVTHENGYEAEIRASIMIPCKESCYLRNGFGITKKFRRNHDCNVVFLCFNAYKFINMQKMDQIGESVYSDAIYNQRHPN
ncbi:uncharacterized protein LOC129606025 [Condylostylus longicornis]|uniref:uncharacterized protein LOC129606025 n=1 Tax=Condylostylus longicornis TaxID=2530218 RepID=UPI00244E3140|nr:uncharacterized protein LOC129606025 [Condylostylus longicornis]